MNGDPTKADKHPIPSRRKLNLARDVVSTGKSSKKPIVEHDNGLVLNKNRGDRI
jgi:hypothetical protein